MIAVLLGSVSLNRLFSVLPDSNKLCMWELVLYVVSHSERTVQVLL